MQKPLDERIQYLEDIEAIKKLHYTYADHVNQGWNGKELENISSLFTENVIFENDEFNIHAKEKKEVLELLKQGSYLPTHKQSFFNPIIDIDGDKATGNWLLWVGIKDDKEENVVFESEDIEYARTEEGWKIASIKLHVSQMLKE